MTEKTHSKKETWVEREKRFLGKALKYYFGGLFVSYLLFIVFREMRIITSGIPEGLLGQVSVFFIIFFLGIPVFLFLRYTVLTLFFLGKKEWESFRFSLLLSVISILIGFGVCYGNIFIIFD